MIALLLVPLFLPWLLPPLARRTAGRVRPEVALWTITAAAGTLAVGVVACLGVLLLPLALAIPPLAVLAHLIHPLQAGPAPLALGVSALSAGIAVVTGLTVLCRGCPKRSACVPSTARLSTSRTPEGCAYWTTPAPTPTRCPT